MSDSDMIARKRLSKAETAIQNLDARLVRLEQLEARLELDERLKKVEQWQASAVTVPDEEPLGNGTYGEL
jgi:hypothetical protein